MARLEMKSGTPVRFIILLPLFLLVMMSALPALCDTEGLNEAESEEDVQDIPMVELKPYNTASVQAGYRFVTPDGPVAAASPYGRLKSGASGGFSAATLGSDLKLSVDGMFLHEDDYHTELFFDYAGYYRVHAESTALWHNLLREQINPGTLNLLENDKGREYGTRSATTQVDTRIKLGNNPFHLNLGYWELKREGYEQLRFSDHAFGAASSSIISEAVRVDRISREGTIGLDGHLKWFDLAYDFRIRDFSNEAPDNRFPFASTANNALITGTGAQAHDTVPDNRVTSHSIKLYSDLSGGLVGTAAYTLTQRENKGGHGDAVPSSQPKDTIHNMAGDLSYTPFKEFSLALKYRHQDIDRETPSSLYYPYSQIPTAGTVPGVYTTSNGFLRVRPASNTVKDTFILSSIFRPYPRMIYRLEYSAELESRDNVRNQQSPAGSPDATHPDSRQTHTGKISLYWRPSNTNMKVNASYSYATCDSQAYGSSFSGQHTGKLLLTYTNSGKWGLTGSYLAKYESGESSARTVPNVNLAVPESAATFSLPHESRNNSANLSFWFSPLERLTLTTSYSLLQLDTDQILLLTNLSRNALAATNYRSTSHVYGLDAVYAVSEQLDLSLGFQQVLSTARFSVPNSGFEIPPTSYSTAGITDLTRLDTTESGVSARADWRVTAMLGCVLDYSFRLFDSGNSINDGSVHTTMLSLKARW